MSFESSCKSQSNLICCRLCQDKITQKTFQVNERCDWESKMFALFYVICDADIDGADFTLKSLLNHLVSHGVIL